MRIKHFTKKERSSFRYWIAHNFAFNLTALTLGVWKFHYLFHDWEKPWLRLFMSYKKVQKFHRNHSRHHIEYFRKHGANKTDWVGMAIDWECSGLTKLSSPMNAADAVIDFRPLLITEYKLTEAQAKEFEIYMRDTLVKLGIYEPTSYYSNVHGFDIFVRTILDGKKFIAKLYIEELEMVNKFDMTLLMDGGRREYLYMTQDGLSYVTKGRYDLDKGERPHMVVFSPTEQSLRKVLAKALDLGIEILDVTEGVNQQFDMENLSK